MIAKSGNIIIKILAKNLLHQTAHFYFPIIQNIQTIYNAKQVKHYQLDNHEAIGNNQKQTQSKFLSYLFFKNNQHDCVGTQQKMMHKVEALCDNQECVSNSHAICFWVVLRRLNKLHILSNEYNNILCCQIINLANFILLCNCQKSCIRINRKGCKYKSIKQFKQIMNHQVSFNIRKHDFSKLKSNMHSASNSKKMEVEQSSPHQSIGVAEDAQPQSDIIENQIPALQSSNKKLIRSSKNTQQNPQLAYQNYLTSLMQQYQPRDQRIIIPYQLKNQKFSLNDQKKQFEQWLGDMHFSVTSSAFRHLIQKNLTFDQVKIYCSENILLNLLLFFENVDNSEAYETMNHINNKLKDNLEYLMAKYPLTKQSKPNKKLRDAIMSINNIENDQNDMLEKSRINFNKKQSGDHTKQIMQFINYIIGMTSSQFQYLGRQTTYFQAFNDVMQKIFEWVEFPEDQVSQDDIFKILTQKQQGIQQFLQQPNIADLDLNQQQLLSDYSFDSVQNMAIQKLDNHMQQMAKIQSPKKNIVQSPKKNNPLFRSYKQIQNTKQQQFFIDNANTLNQKQLKQYRQKVKKFTSFRIGQKINPNTETYTDQEIQYANFSVKSTALLRIMTKWIGQLQKKIFKAKQFLMKRSFRFKSKKQDNFIKLDSIEKNKLYQTAQRYVKILRDYQKYMSKQCIGIEADLSKRILSEKQMKQLPVHEFIVGMFCTKLESAASTYLINYLNQLISALISIPEQAHCQANQVVSRQKKKSKCKDVNLVTFKISDLMRCKCTSHENQILRIFNLLKRISDTKPQLLKIVRIKDRLELGTKDILININFANKILCEIQLGIVDAIEQKQKMYDSFSHYLYELHRSQLGPLMQCSCIWTHLDQRSKQFKKFLKKTEENFCTNRKVVDHSNCKDSLLSPYKFSFVCSLCGVFHAFLPGIITNKKCITCQSYYQCRKCIENRMSQRQLKNHLGLLNGHFKHFQAVFQEWMYTGSNDLPNYGFLIPRKAQTVKYYFFQKIRFKQTDYFINVQESNNQQKNLKIATIFSVKNQSYNEIIQLSKHFFVYQWTQKRLVNKTLISDSNQQKKLVNKVKKNQEYKKLQESMRKAKADILKRREDLKILMNQDVKQVQPNTNPNQKVLIPSVDEKKQEDISKKEKENAINGNQLLNKVIAGRKQLLAGISQGLHYSPSRPNSAKSQMSDNNIPINIQIDAIVKRSSVNDIRISQIKVKSTTYTLFLGYYMNESSIKAYLKQQINQKIIKQLLQNRNEVFSLQQQQISNQMQFDDKTVEKYTKSLATVSEIYLEENKITDLSIIQHFPKLRILNCSNNSVQSTMALKNLRYLYEVNFSRNKLDDLSGLSNKGKLTHLHLSFNDISKIQLSGLAKLKLLSLSYNKLQNIPELSECINLVDLQLAGNFITEIEGLQALKQLESLNLSMNEIQIIEKLNHNKALTHLDLSLNQITQIANLSQLSELKYLNLYKNKIKSVTCSELNCLQKLEQLDLGNNYIAQLCQDLMLTKLKKLLLTNNIINVLSIQKYENMKDLQFLDLSDNRITLVKYDIFKLLKNLKQVNLACNPIKKTDKKNQQAMRKIKEKGKTIRMKIF